MARANRYILPEQIYHVTHRCHDRSFLLRCARDRDAYRAMLRDRAGRFGVVVLGYCLTSKADLAEHPFGTKPEAAFAL